MERAISPTLEGCASIQSEMRTKNCRIPLDQRTERGSDSIAPFRSQNDLIRRRCRPYKVLRSAYAQELLGSGSEPRVKVGFMPDAVAPTPSSSLTSFSGVKMKQSAFPVSRHTLRRVNLFAGAGVFVAALVVTALTAREASPVGIPLHIGLASSVPAKDAHLTAAPREIRLTFTGVINVATAGVELAAADGKHVTLDTLRAVPDSTKVAVAKITGTVTKGTYTVTWRAVAADGAKGTGTFNFMYMPPDQR